MNLPEKPRYKTFIQPKVTLIGGGGIGSILGPLLSKCGARELLIYDNDSFADVNLQVQNCRVQDLGRPKALCVKEQMLELNPTTTITAIQRRFTQDDVLDGIVVAAVDSLEGRQLIFDSVLRHRDAVMLYIEGRLSRKAHEYFDVFSVNPKASNEVKAYEPWLFRGKVLPKDPRPEDLAAHTPYGLAWAVGCILARFIKGEDRPWRITGDGVATSVESFHNP